MDPRIETVTKGWRFRSCQPGYGGLHALAEGGFSGSVAADGATGFMVNGRLVGIANGSIESFWSSDISALETDEPVEALLCGMLIEDDSVEAEYYTGETSISTVHKTLANGSFSGYIELSENVFSGDYFVLYYGGTAKSVALLGTEDRVITGEEAFDRASDEVGIYEVKSVDIEIIDIPEPEVDDSGTDEPDPIEEQPEPSGQPEPETQSPDPTPEPSPVPDEPVDPPEPQPDTTLPPSVDATDPDDGDLATLAEAASGGNAASVTSPASSTIETLDQGALRTIPALDPNRSSDPEPEPEANPEPAPESEIQPTPEPEQTPEPAQPSPEVEELETELDSLRRENERLKNQIAELETTLAEYEADEEAEMSRSAALDGTNLFVRYEAQGRNTLENALDGTAEPDTIQRNIRLERHTRFEAADVTVDGEPFEAFLEASLEYRFADWLLRDLLFELAEAGQHRAFQGLIEAIPEVDRVEFQGTVPVHTEEAGERSSQQFEFDIVCRDSMGAALLIANVHDARTPVGDGEVGDLLAEANAITTAKPSLKGAMFVSRSYFEPGALETVADATGGGLLRGSSRESYVSVNRKHGFHLCLVEARDSTFHLNVPDS